MEAALLFALVGAMFVLPIAWMFVRRGRAEGAMRQAAESLGGHVAEFERKDFFDPGLELKAEVDGRRVKVGMRLSKKKVMAKVKITRGPLEIIRLVATDSLEGRATMAAYAQAPELAPTDLDGVLIPALDTKRGVAFLREQTEVLALFRELRPSHLVFMVEDVSSDTTSEGYVEVLLASGFTDPDRLAKATRLAGPFAGVVERFPKT